MKNTNLYDEDGIKIGLTEFNDVCHPGDEDCVQTVTGHQMYCCSAKDAERAIRAEYLSRKRAPIGAQLTQTEGESDMERGRR